MISSVARPEVVGDAEPVVAYGNCARHDVRKDQMEPEPASEMHHQTEDHVDDRQSSGPNRDVAPQVRVDRVGPVAQDVHRTEQQRRREQRQRRVGGCHAQAENTVRRVDDRVDRGTGGRAEHGEPQVATQPAAAAAAPRLRSEAPPTPQAPHA